VARLQDKECIQKGGFHTVHLSTPPPLNEILQRLGDLWSDDCRAFITHWAQLRGNALIPATETFFDNPEARFAPCLYVVDLTGDTALVRLQGTALDERWTARLTGKDLHDGMSATVRRRSLSNMRQIVAQPCGYLARNVYRTSTDRDVIADLVQLPLAVQAGRPPRVVCLSLMQRDDDMEETVADFHTEALAWIDLGAGVPRDPPLDLID
jgi:hypothetical protein